MLKIINLQMGNIGSVINAINYLGVEHQVITKPSELIGATHIILPGVGSFASASKKLHESGFKESLMNVVLVKKIPFLGICVGMQLLAKVGYEGGVHQGLGWIDAEVSLLNSFNQTLQVPHIGWNDVTFSKELLFNNISEKSCFYFVHSYALKIKSNTEFDIAYTDYGENVVAYVNKDNIYGVQFHPEKSQAVGLQFLKNFMALC